MERTEPLWSLEGNIWALSRMPIFKAWGWLPESSRFHHGILSQEATSRNTIPRSSDFSSKVLWSLGPNDDLSGVRAWQEKGLQVPALYAASAFSSTIPQVGTVLPSWPNTWEYFLRLSSLQGTGRMLWALIYVWVNWGSVSLGGLLRVTQQWVVEEGLPEISLSEDGRAELESKAHAYSFFQTSKEGYLCSKLSCLRAVVVSFEGFKDFKSACILAGATGVSLILGSGI